MTVAGDGKCVYISLRPRSTQPRAENGGYLSSADWGIDEQELEAAFTPRTKLLVINTPNNPLGKIYTREELEKIAALCIKHNVICVADEVYEHITYDRPLTRICKLSFLFFLSKASNN